MTCMATPHYKKARKLISQSIVRAKCVESLKQNPEMDLISTIHSFSFLKVQRLKVMNLSLIYLGHGVWKCVNLVLLQRLVWSSLFSIIIWFVCVGCLATGYYTKGTHLLEEFSRGWNHFEWVVVIYSLKYQNKCLDFLELSFFLLFRLDCQPCLMEEHCHLICCYIASQPRPRLGKLLLHAFPNHFL